MDKERSGHRFLLVRDPDTKEIGGCLWWGESEDVSHGEAVGSILVTFLGDVRGIEQAAVFKGMMSLSDISMEVFDRIFTLGFNAGQLVGSEPAAKPPPRRRKTGGKRAQRP